MDIDEANSGPRARPQRQTRANIEVRPPKAGHGEETQDCAGRRRQLTVAFGYAQGHGHDLLTQNDYRKQREALGDVARMERHASHEARTDHCGNSQIDHQPDPHSRKRHGSGTTSETVNSATLKLNAAT